MKITTHFFIICVIICRLDAQIAVAKKKQAKSDDAESKTEEEFTSFLSELQDLHTTYATKYPKDVKSTVRKASNELTSCSHRYEKPLNFSTLMFRDFVVYGV